VLAAALERGHRFADLSFGEYARDFEGTRRDWLCRFPARRGLFRPGKVSAHLARRLGKSGMWLAARTGWPTAFDLATTDMTCDLDSPELRALVARRGPVLFAGWELRTRTLAAHAEVIRRHFAPVPAHARAVAALHAQLRARADLVIGVHVRRGDYAGWKGGQYFWEPAAYVALARRVASLFAGRRALFLVASNEPIDPALWADLPFAPAPGHPVQDLYALAGCDLLFGPPSTFSQWASFYGDVPLWTVERPEATPSLADFRR
jgi:hypothetical protein